MGAVILSEEGMTMWIVLIISFYMNEPEPRSFVQVAKSEDECHTLEQMWKHTSLKPDITKNQKWPNGIVPTEKRRIILCIHAEP